MPTATIRYDERVREEVAPLLDSMGLSLNAYLNLALNQLAIQGRVPFEIEGRRPAGRYVPVKGASPRARVVDGRLVVPADWDDDDDE